MDHDQMQCEDIQCAWCAEIDPYQTENWGRVDEDDAVDEV